ncbi:MAG: hypothetical protein WAK50_11460 [Nitrososphaeraceae archaeon]
MNKTIFVVTVTMVVIAVGLFTGILLPNTASAFHSYAYDWICWEADTDREWICGSEYCDNHAPPDTQQCGAGNPCEQDREIDSCWPGPYRYYGPPEEGLPGGVPCTDSTPCGTQPTPETYECVDIPSTPEEKAACEKACARVAYSGLICGLLAPGNPPAAAICGGAVILAKEMCESGCKYSGATCGPVTSPDDGGVLRSPDDGTSGGVLRTPPDGGVLRTPPDGGSGSDAGEVIFRDEDGDSDPVISNPVGGTNDGDDGVVVFGEDGDSDPVIGNPDGGTDGGEVLESSQQGLSEEIEEDFDECPEGTTLVGRVDCISVD